MKQVLNKLGISNNTKFNSNEMPFKSFKDASFYCATKYLTGNGKNTETV